MKKINNENQQLFSKLVKAPSTYSYESLVKLNQERAKLQQKLLKYDKDGKRKENALERKVNKLRLSTSNFDSARRDGSNEPLAVKIVEEENTKKFATQNEAETFITESLVKPIEDVIH
jgi:hypothetical protein